MIRLQQYITEARMNYWMIVSIDSDASYLVAAPDLDGAKDLVASVEGCDPKDLVGWLINDLTKVKNPRIVYDSVAIKSKGDKKY